MVADLREQIIGTHVPPLKSEAHVLSTNGGGTFSENCKFLFYGCNPIVLTRCWIETDPHGDVYTKLHAFVVERLYSCFIPIDTDLDATGVLVDVRHNWYGAPNSDHYPYIMNQLLVQTQNLIHEKVEKQSAEAADVEVEVEKFLSRLAPAVQNEDEEMKERLRKRLLRRAFNELASKERKRRDDLEDRVDKLMEILTLSEESVKEKEMKRKEEEKAIEHAEEVRALLAEEEQLRVDEMVAEEEENLISQYQYYDCDFEERGIEQAIELEALLKEEKLRIEKTLFAREEQLRVDKMAAEEEQRLEIQLAVHIAETFAEEKYSALQREYNELEMDYVTLRDELSYMESEARYRENESNVIRDGLEQQLANAKEKARVDVERERGFRKALEGAIDVFRQTEVDNVEELESVRRDLDLTRAQFEVGIERQIKLEDELRKVQDEYARRARRTKEGTNKIFYTSRTEDIKELLAPIPEAGGSTENTDGSPVEFTPPSSPGGRFMA